MEQPQRQHRHRTPLLKGPFAILCDALQARRVIRFIYKGQARTAEPHILGWDHQEEAILSAWQLSGGSAAAFRTYHVEAMSKIVATRSGFERPRDAYNPDHGIFAQIACRL